MSRVYDNWEKLVGAVLRREKDRQLACCESFSSSYSADFSSRFSEDQEAGDVEAIEYEEIRKATRNFAPNSFVGEGTYSFVYEGWIDEHNLVAIILMKDKNYINPQKWMNEISHLRHPNLVTPVGYCFNTDQTIFVYELERKGSLANHLFIRRWQQPLPWATRMKVALGAARGLAFFHSLEKPLTNGMFRSADILLDSDFNAKLLSIGLKEELDAPCSIYEIEGPLGIVDVVEHSPYAAPEYMQIGNLSTKCVVYSFGVVLVELLTGCRDRSRSTSEINLIPWATPFLEKKTRLSRIMDSRLEGQYHRKQACAVAQLALQCVSSDPRSRPEMAEVVAALQELYSPTT